MQDTKPAQDFVPIKEIRRGIVVLNDGSMRVVLMVSSTNFALKSAGEQQAILTQFQNFLNSLDFTIQISIESRSLDIRPYVALLEKQYKKQTKDLLKIQTKEYIDFIKDFVGSVNIMSKNFFIVIPYESSGLTEGKGKIKSIFGDFLGKSDKNKNEDDKDFEEKKGQLEQRISVITSGVKRMGLDTVKLENEELIELYYKKFNPGESEKPIQLSDN